MTLPRGECFDKYFLCHLFNLAPFSLARSATKSGSGQFYELDMMSTIFYYLRTNYICREALFFSVPTSILRYALWITVLSFAKEG